MPLDAVCVSALAAELNSAAVGAKIDKVQQPEKDVLLLSLRTPGGNARLLLSAASGSARAHFTRVSRENPAAPPMFCMLLRKHLTGGRIVSVTQPQGERLLDFGLTAFDEMGMERERHLICEMLGKHPNLILTDEEGRIVDCLHKIDAEISEKRQLLPGLYYKLPPQPEKPGLLSVEEAAFTAALADAPPEQEAAKWLVQRFAGISPMGARELVCAACGDAYARVEEIAPADLAGAHAAFIRAVGEGHFTPCLVSIDGVPRDFYCFWVKQYGDGAKVTAAESFSTLLDDFYTERERLEHLSRRSQAVQKTVKNLRDRTARKLAAQTEELKATYGRERLREFGDLIKANLWRMERGADKLTAEDFYAPEGGSVDIPLDPKLNPQQNAARYYKQYGKAKNAEKVLTEQIASAETELDYLESVLEELGRAETEKDLSAIRRELIQGGYLREQGGRKKMKQPEAAPMEFHSSTGVRILCGRNNLQNDQLTKNAFRGDTWLHIQKLHGSHVIIQTQGAEPDETTLAEAAAIAAWYSKGRGGSKLPVDYTKVRYVKKQPGAKPGMVLYTDYKTILVSPTEEEIKALRKG